MNRSAIGTVVERSSRYTLLVHLPRLKGYGTIAPVKNGPALGGYGAIAMKDALTTTMTTMPAELLRSLTWDRGKELSAHAQFKVDTGIAVYFADPHSPWQRGTNENTNGPKPLHRTQRRGGGPWAELPSSDVAMSRRQASLLRARGSARRRRATRRTLRSVPNLGTASEIRARAAPLPRSHSACSAVGAIPV